VGSITNWIMVAATVVGLSAGQILFKLGATRINQDFDRSLLAWLNWPIVAALVIYGVSTVIWIWALRTMPLRMAYPVSALGFFFVPVLGHYFLGEDLSVRTIVGAMVIILGIVISTSAA
jgi:multidrug transporter EmrE-like cation transporter